MDPRTILEGVSAKYAALRTLAIDGFVVTDSGDENASTRQRTRIKAWYAAPSHVRIERAGRGGTVMVSNGIDVIRDPLLPNRYSKGPVNRMYSAGQFDPHHPDRSDAFLFARIAENIRDAKYLGQESDRHRIAASYDAGSPVEFHVDVHSRPIMHVGFETSHRMPADDETLTTHHDVDFESCREDEPIAPEAFEYSPPEDAVEMSRPGGFIGGGGGSVRASGRYETWHSTECEGSTLTERFKLKFEGIDLALERRLIFSEDRRQLRILDRVEGPKGQTECEFMAPLRD